MYECLLSYMLYSLNTLPTRRKNLIVFNVLVVIVIVEQYYIVKDRVRCPVTRVFPPKRGFAAHSNVYFPNVSPILQKDGCYQALVVKLD